MFIEILKTTEVVKDHSGLDMMTKTKTYYVCSGQTLTDKVKHPDTQAYYKKLFELQENKSAEIGRPISILEILNPLNPL